MSNRRLAGLIGTGLLCALGAGGAPARAFELKSEAFAAGEVIPVDQTCDGKNESPPLAWREPPDKTASFALVCEDPDAPSGTFVHWVLYGLPAATRSLPPGVPSATRLADGSRQGKNDFAKTGYGGPCPPRGKPHRYVFKLYALDVPLDLPPDASASALQKAIAGHDLAH